MEFWKLPTVRCWHHCDIKEAIVICYCQHPSRIWITFCVKLRYQKYNWLENFVSDYSIRFPLKLAVFLLCNFVITRYGQLPYNGTLNINVQHDAHRVQILYYISLGILIAFKFSNTKFHKIGRAVCPHRGILLTEFAWKINELRGDVWMSATFYYCFHNIIMWHYSNIVSVSTVY